MLPGVSRQTVIDLSKSENLPLHEADIDLYDAYNADEAFLTSTSLCICPISKINGVNIGPPGAGVGTCNRKARRRLSPLRRFRLRWPVPEALRRRHGIAGFLKCVPDIVVFVRRGSFPGNGQWRVRKEVKWRKA